MKILNLYAGIGGNRLHWNGHEITAVESNKQIAAIYQSNFPDDTLIIGDARQFLIENFNRFDFIWSSPPCQENTRLPRTHSVVAYPSLVHYEQAIFLNRYFKGKYCIENVDPYYKPLMKFQALGRHLFWCNFVLPSILVPSIDLEKANVPELKKYLGMPDDMKTAPYRPGSNYAQVLRNCVHPLIGRAILEKVEGNFNIARYRPGLLFSD